MTQHVNSLICRAGKQKNWFVLWVVENTKMKSITIYVHEIMIITYNVLDVLLERLIGLNDKFSKQFEGKCRLVRLKVFKFSRGCALDNKFKQVLNIIKNINFFDDE